MTYNGTTLSSPGLNAGFSQTSPNLNAIITNFYFPRTADLQNGWFQDYQDEFAYIYGVIGLSYVSVTPTPDNGASVAVIFQDNSSTIEYNTGDTMGTIQIVVNCTNAQITPKGNGTYALGLTFRSDPSRANANPTNIQIECYDNTTSTWDTVYNQPVSLGNGYVTWVSPTWAAPVNTGYAIVQCRITLTMPNPLGGNFRLQRAILYHATCAWDTFHLSVGGGNLSAT